MTNHEPFVETLRVCCDALDKVPSRDAGACVGYLADKYIGAYAAQACYRDLPTLSAAQRAVDARRSAESMIALAERLEEEARAEAAAKR